jgi:SAM-dependent methyltransferase
MGDGDSTRDVHRREAQFHDGWACGEDVARVRVREVFESPVAMENRFILRHMGPLQGKRILDLGAGLGESSVYFAGQGARVTLVDLSPAMLEFARALAAHWGVKIETIVGRAEDFDAGTDRFDFAYAANLLHHVPDKRAVFGRVRAALVPGGRFFLIDPLRYNPIINTYRRMASQVRTEDERPLGFEDIALAREFFDDVGHREFWILSLALFLKYYLWDGVHPNAERYWKKIFTDAPEALWWWLPLRLADAWVTRIPLIRRLAWNTVIWGRKGPTPPC